MKYSQMSNEELFTIALDKAGYIQTDGLTVMGNKPCEEDLKQCFLDYADSTISCLSDYTYDDILDMIEKEIITPRRMAMNLIQYCK